MKKFPRVIIFIPRDSLEAICETSDAVKITIWTVLSQRDISTRD